MAGSKPFAMFQSYYLQAGNYIRIPLSEGCNALVSTFGTNGSRQGLYFVGGYGEGTVARNVVKSLCKSSWLSEYINGGDESSCVYIGGSGGGSETIIILPLVGRIQNVTTVSSVPSGATKI